MPDETSSGFDKITRIFPFLLPLTIVMIVIFLGAAIGIFIYPLFQVGPDKLGGASTDAARSLITFFVAIITVAIAIILTLSVLLSTAPDYDKRFAQGKEILTIFVGVLGTIVGFYFGSAPKTPDLPSVTQNSRAVLQTAGEAAKAFETNGFNALLRQDFATAVDEFDQAVKIWPDYHNVTEIKSLLQAKRDRFEKASAEEKLVVFDEIYCDIVSKYTWKMSDEFKKQFTQKLQRTGCSPAAA